MKSHADIGVIGLAVMGENLILNMASRGIQVACYNRTTSRVTDFLEGRAKGKNIVGAYSIAEFCAALEKPRRAMLMVKAGKPVDDFIAQLLEHLEPGDIIIDGGNSYFEDTPLPRTPAPGHRLHRHGHLGGRGRGAARSLDHARG